MISLFEIVQNINEAEVDDDKIVKYKDKEGESQEMTAGAAKKQPDDHPAKQAWNKMAGDGGDGEKDSGGKLGKGDFDRDANRAADDEADDMDRDVRFDADAEDDEDDEDDEKTSESENEKIISSIEDIATDIYGGYTVDSEDSAIDDGQYAVISAADSGNPDNEMSVNAFPDGNGVGYGINVGAGHKMIYFDSKEEALEAAKKLLKNSRIRAAMDARSDETLADLGDHAESVLKSKDETITINGKKYKSIKESKKNPQLFKEIYERTFRSLK